MDDMKCAGSSTVPEKASLTTDQPNAWLREELDCKMRAAAARLQEQRARQEALSAAIRSMRGGSGDSNAQVEKTRVASMMPLSNACLTSYTSSYACHMSNFPGSYACVCLSCACLVSNLLSNGGCREVPASLLPNTGRTNDCKQGPCIRPARLSYNTLSSTHARRAPYLQSSDLASHSAQLWMQGLVLQVGG